MRKNRGNFYACQHWPSGLYAGNNIERQTGIILTDSNYWVVYRALKSTYFEILGYSSQPFFLCEKANGAGPALTKNFQPINIYISIVDAIFETRLLRHLNFFGSLPFKRI
jgi:hypothetical protein